MDAALCRFETLKTVHVYLAVREGVASVNNAATHEQDGRKGHTQFYRKVESMWFSTLVCSQGLFRDMLAYIVVVASRAVE